MHKGYTIPYFIDFFENIPNSRWATRTFGCADDKACALGHAGSYNEDGDPRAENREAALVNILPNVIAVNDACPNDYLYKLGKTPRTRVLKALKLRKKLGTNWDTNL